MQNPLVSVVISTYNSANFILQTLDSIRDQTYPELELIVTDDASKDNTVALCRQWFAENGARFQNTHLLTSAQNTGIAGNANRGIEVTKGEWIKFLGGDDLLLPRCIESNMEVARKHPENALIISKVVYFDSDTDKDINVLPVHNIPANDGAAQLKGLLKGNYLKSPGLIVKKEVLKKLGLFDTRFPMYEDDPFYIKANLAGYYFVENPEVLVRYRLHSGAVSNGFTGFVSPVFYPSLRNFRVEVIIPLLKEKGMYAAFFFNKARFWLSDRIVKKGNDLKAPRNILERIGLKIISLLEK